MELTELKGIGESRKKQLEYSGIFSSEDLINYFPYKYYDFSNPQPYCEDGKIKIILAKVKEKPKIFKTRTHLSIISCKVTDSFKNEFTAIWFNQSYIVKQLTTDTEVYLYGKNSNTKKNTFNVLLHKLAKNIKTDSLLPIYHTVLGLGQKVLFDTINEAIYKENITSIIPDNLLLKHNLIDLKLSYKNIHNLRNINSLQTYKDRVSIEQLLPILSINEYENKNEIKEKLQLYNHNNNIISQFQNLLNFQLTSDQLKSISEIYNDMSSSKPMNRLLQGDVGSGKTVVSLFGAYLSAISGYQSLIVAPTEILTSQHYETIKNLFNGTNISVYKLTNSTPKNERTKIISEIRFGYAQIVISTHSILSDEIKFKNLSYIAIDEQHRFGVEQRAVIKSKGQSPDILVMSATPIPRSLSLALSGYLDISTINSRPKENNIETHLVIKSKQNDMWNYLKNKAENGEKIFVVCSKIDEENEDDELLNYSAKNMFQFLQTIFKKEQIGLIHGKLKKDEQNTIIEKFRTSSMNILVSTTIIEVGVDIPKCKYMVIATPERFGLATLHQLRGRIGRNGEKSYCFCLLNNQLSENSYERIKYFQTHLNGFDIAEFDLNTRGSGSIFNTNQHGESNDLFSNFSCETLKLAKELLSEIKSDENNYQKLLSKGREVKYQKFTKKITFN